MQKIKLGFGFMRLPLVKTEEKEEYDKTLIKEMVDRFIEGGGTYFDTALAYGFGGSEKMLKMSVVDRYPRQSFTIADKLPLWLLKDKGLSVEEMFQMSLTNLGVDYIDYYLVHALSGDRIQTAEEVGAWDFVKKMKEEGKVKHMGFSFHGTPDELESLLAKHPEADFVQLQINYADWEDERIASRRCYEIVTAHQKPVFVMEPVKGGTLANMGAFQREPFEAFGKTPASFALRFAASLENTQVVLSGMNSMEQVNDNLNTFNGSLAFDPEEKKALDEVLKRLKSSETVGCTACKYCMETCPMEIPIPRIFSRYNHYLTFGSLKDSFGKSGRFADEGNGPSDCIGCGECQAHCPQHLPIPELMQKIAEIKL